MPPSADGPWRLMGERLRPGQEISCVNVQGQWSCQRPTYEPDPSNAARGKHSYHPVGQSPCRRGIYLLAAHKTPIRIEIHQNLPKRSDPGYYIEDQLLPGRTVISWCEEDMKWRNVYRLVETNIELAIEIQGHFKTLAVNETGHKTATSNRIHVTQSPFIFHPQETGQNIPTNGYLYIQPANYIPTLFMLARLETGEEEYFDYAEGKTMSVDEYMKSLQVRHTRIVDITRAPVSTD